MAAEGGMRREGQGRKGERAHPADCGLRQFAENDAVAVGICPAAPHMGGKGGEGEVDVDVDVVGNASVASLHCNLLRR